jgi:hypothetical protein
MSNYSLLHEDLDDCMANHKANLHASKSNRVFSDEEDKPIAEINKFLLAKDTRAWPKDKELIDFGRSFGLNCIETLALVLKAQFEVFCMETNDNGNRQSRMILLNNLKSDPYKAKRYSLEFNVGINGTAGEEEIYQLFEDSDHLASDAGYTIDKFGTLINQMIISNMHLFAQDSHELKVFIEKEKKEQDLLKGASEADKEELWIKNRSLYEVKREQSELLFNRERQRLENANINNKFLKTFGKDYVPLVETMNVHDSLQRRIDIKKENLELSEEEVNNEEAKIRKEQEENLEKLKEDIAFAEISGLVVSDKNYATPEEIVEYDKAQKKVLRDICKLTHPDSIGNENFTPNQLKRIDEFYKKAIDIHKSEIGSSRRSLSILVDICDSVKRLWESMGVDIDEDLIIQKNTLEEQLNFLEETIVRIERTIKAIKEELFILLNDPDIREKQASMSSPEQISQIIEEMKNKKIEYENKNEELRKEYERLFL